MIGVVSDKPVSSEQSSRNGPLVRYIKVCKSNTLEADLSGRAIYGVGLWRLACWDCGFESRRGHGCMSLVSVVLSGRGLCVALITRPEECYRVWCV